MILNDPKISDATAIKMVKPLARLRARLTKRIRLCPTPAATPDKEDEGMAEGPLENMLRKIIKGTTPKRKAVIATPATSGTVSTKKKRLLPPTPTLQKKPPLPQFPF